MAPVRSLDVSHLSDHSVVICITKYLHWARTDTILLRSPLTFGKQASLIAKDFKFAWDSGDLGNKNVTLSTTRGET